MPVRVDSMAFGLSGHPCFDCDVLSELKDISEDLMSADMTDIDCLSADDDIWKTFDDFLLTPPQSPPIKLDLVSDLLDMTSGDSIGFSDSSVLHNADVLHDCMWSGQCAEDTVNACLNHHNPGNCSTQPIRMCDRRRPETPFNTVSTSPFAMHSSFNDLLSTMSDTSSNGDDSQSSMDDEDFSGGDSSQSSTSCSNSFAKVKESLINDHSYGGSPAISHNQKDMKLKNVCGMQSLIYPKNSGYKIKCHKINGKKIKIIKANSPNSITGCSSAPKSKQSKDEKTHSNSGSPVPVPTVRIIRNDKHLVKSKNQCIDSKQSVQKDCKFSTRRKSSTVSSERKVMLAQNVLKNKSASPVEDDDEEVDTASCGDRVSKVPPMKRREHNDSERKRRDHLRNAFVGLRDQIPKLKSSEKRPPRILILHEATNYVLQLNEKQKYLERTLNAEMEKREKLLKVLSQEIKVESI